LKIEFDDWPPQPSTADAVQKPERDARLREEHWLLHNEVEIFPRKLTRELIREISPLTKIAVLFVAVVFIGGMLYLGFAAYKEVQRNRHLLIEQSQRLAQLEAQGEQTRQEVSRLARSSKEILSHSSLAPRLWNEYSNGVCLISGSYIFVDARTGRPLRLPKSSQDEKEPLRLKGEQQPWLTPEGEGEIAEVDYVGTGFHVGNGYFLTNRHIVIKPWADDVWANILSAMVNARLRLGKLVAYFPGHPRPYPLTFKQASSQDDLAVCTLDVKELLADIPALLLNTSPDAVTVGEAIVMMGYPSGADRLLALLPEKEAGSLQRRYGGSGTVLLSQLAKRNLIKPLMTQGHIMDLHSNQLAYDAVTSEGGSGAPVFGQSGRVIGVHFGFFIRNRTSNFAVPISRGIALLQQAGWQPTEQP
jgi:S1-C subfamily serine protease